MHICWEEINGCMIEAKTTSMYVVYVHLMKEIAFRYCIDLESATRTLNLLYATTH